MLGRTAAGFDPQAPLLREIAADPLLADRGADRRALGHRPRRLPARQLPAALARVERPLPRPRPPLLARRRRTCSARFATALAGSSRRLPAARDRAASTSSPPTTASPSPTSSPTATSTTRPTARRNRDGHGENLSWNNGVEGPTDDPAVRAERRRDLRALLATLFASRGTIMLTAGDEFGRTPARQQQRLRPGQPDHLARLGRPRPRRSRPLPPRLAALRRAHPALADPALLTGAPGAGRHPRRRLADPRRHARRPPPTGRPPAARRSPWCSAAAATAASPSSSTASAHEVAFRLPRARRPPLGGAPARPRHASGPAPSPSSPSCRGGRRAREARPPLEPGRRAAIDRARPCESRRIGENSMDRRTLLHAALAGLVGDRLAARSAAPAHAQDAPAAAPLQLRRRGRARPRGRGPALPPPADGDGRALRRPEVRPIPRHPLPRRQAALHRRRPQLPDGPDAAGLLRSRTGSRSTSSASGSRRAASRSRPTSSTSTPTTSPTRTAARRPGLAGDMGFSGMRFRHPLNRPGVWDEFAVFQGASYFRAVAHGTLYGLSARGLAIGTGGAGPEEFPIFTAFWVHEPQPGDRVLRLSALLDSDSVAGAFDFALEPGAETVMQVRSRPLPAPRHRHRRHRAADLDVLLRPRAPRAASTTSATPCTTATACASSTAPASGCGGRCATPSAVETSSFADDNPRAVRPDPARARLRRTTRTPRPTTSSGRAPGSSRAATGAAAR